ncbi:VOC family protein [Aquincola sp. S2]|uniref:VOC family protein n=1 Tax=Pseudaquabacterium terrae TaxID=2732868 RepID=A0ABX2EEH9_9BURK|nr:VOC family protein [Aquabacterium terrae]NRF67020.1 VOC family protein [Aquabacterium terrae]
MQKIAPFLWFDTQAEEAVELYTRLFNNARTGKVARYGEAGPGPKGSVMTASFELEGQEFIALNGGPMFKFSPAISFVVRCETQAEIDHLWVGLSEGGSTQQCGWLTDRFGVSWQVVPSVLEKLLTDPDPQRAQRVMQAMLGMVKFDIAGLHAAYEKS